MFSSHSLMEYAGKFQIILLFLSCAGFLAHIEPDNVGDYDDNLAEFIDDRDEAHFPAPGQKRLCLCVSECFQLFFL